MKKIDKLLLSSFIGPFFVSFGIALFVLIMQFLWLYIDEIAGKGVSMFIMAELIGYLSVATFPMALPIAVLIASVMVMGNMAERYELSSIKSAGVSLVRLLASLIVACAFIGAFSYICSNYLIPIANLKFKSRLYDIRKQKPALTLEEGVFNEDFRQFVIRIGDKEKDGETLKNVLIEDQTGAGRLKFNQILADSGQMFTTEDKRFFVMNLFEGTQYQEPSPGGTQQRQKYPFIRTNFKSWTKVWDLKEFEMNRTDEDRFKTQRSMLSMNQLRMNIDSLEKSMYDGKIALAGDMLQNIKKVQTIPAVLPDTTKPRSLGKVQMDRSAPKAASSTATTNKSATSPAKQQGGPVAAPTRNRNQEVVPPKSNPIKRPKTKPKPPLPPPPTQPKLELPAQILHNPLDSYASILETFKPEDRLMLVNKALPNVSNGKSLVESRSTQIENRRKEAVKTGYELYTKYSFALVCFIFLFIGAPMGAIIRKGGFGYPILVSIIFFVVFIVLTITCRKLAETYLLTPFWAAMTPCIILSPIGAFLTTKAMNDSQMINTDRIDQTMQAIGKFLRIIKPKSA